MGNLPYRSYVVFVGGFAAAALWTLDWPAVFTLSQADLFGLCILTILGLMSESLALTIVVGQNVSNSSITFILILASALIFGPSITVLFTATTGAVAEFGIRRKPPSKALFNVAQYIVATASAGIAFNAAGGSAGVGAATGPFVHFFVRQIFPFLTYAAVLFSVNLAAVSLWIALRQGLAFGPILTRWAGPAGTNVLYDLLVSPIAVAVAILYEELYVGGLLLSVLPLLFIRHSYFTNLRLQEANRDLLYMMVKAIETRDPYTSGHSRRVALMARRMGDVMGLPGKTVESIETAALLHDIGKIDVEYVEIIRKPSQLSDAERRVIQSHSSRGADLIRSLSSFRSEVVSAVRHHHERYDGSGYPEGLRGKQIPLGARIIMVCDAVDAMMSDRPYRLALSLAQIQEELYAGKGAQFDPDVVSGLLASDLLDRHLEEVAPEKVGSGVAVGVGL